MKARKRSYTLPPDLPDRVSWNSELTFGPATHPYWQGYAAQNGLERRIYEREVDAADEKEDSGHDKGRGRNRKQTLVVIHRAYFCGIPFVAHSGYPPLY